MPVLFCISPYLQEEAEEVLGTLIPRLNHQCAEAFGLQGLEPLQDLFSQEALWQHQDDVYDPQTGTVTSRQTAEWETLAEEDDWEFAGLDIEVVDTDIVNNTNPPPPSAFGHDTQTIASIREQTNAALNNSRVQFQVAREGILRNGNGGRAQGLAAGAQ
jgi:hypothetical protein